jgi:alkaline phosphatase D
MESRNTSKAVMKIAFTSCMSTGSYAASQPVWSAIAKSKPDVLVLLGDSVYIDCPPEPDTQGNGHPSDAGYNDSDFAHHLHHLYRRQLQVPEFRDLISEPGLQTWAIWDDHDFLWNDADSTVARRVQHRGKAILSGNLLRFWRQALAAHGTGFPVTSSDAAVWTGHHPPFTSAQCESAKPGYTFVPLTDAIKLHLTDGRSWRKRGQILGAAQRARIEQKINEAPDAVHIIASGSTFGRTGRNGWADAHADRNWLLTMAGRYRILMISGDIHRNVCPQPIGCGPSGRKFHEVTASGAAVNFNPFQWDGQDPGNSWLNYSQKWGLLEFDSGMLNISTIDHGHSTPSPHGPIVVSAW